MLRSILLSTVIAASVSVVANADTADPYVHIGDPNNGTPVGWSFTFTSNANGGGVFNFTNALGNTMSSLDFFVTLPADESFTCPTAPFFSTCEVQQVAVPDSPAGRKFGPADFVEYDIGFDPGPDHPGIPNGASFTIYLNDPINGIDNPDPNGAGGWGPNNTIYAVANLPEPSSWALLLCAFATLSGGLYRKFRASRVG